MNLAETISKHMEDREETCLKKYQQKGRDHWFRLPNVRVREGATWHWAKKVAETEDSGIAYCWILQERGGMPILFHACDVDESEVPRLRSNKKSPPPTEVSPSCSSNEPEGASVAAATAVRAVPRPKTTKSSRTYSIIYRSIPRNQSMNQKSGSLQCKWTGKTTGGVYICVLSSAHQYKDTNEEIVAIEDVNLLDINPPEARLRAIRELFQDPQYDNKEELRITIHRHHPRVSRSTKRKAEPAKQDMQQEIQPSRKMTQQSNAGESTKESPFETMRRLCFSNECSEAECQKLAEPLLSQMQLLEQAKSLKVGMWISIWLEIDRVYDIVQIVELPRANKNTSSGKQQDDSLFPSELKCKVKYLSDGSEETVNLLDGFLLHTKCNNHDTIHKLQPGRALKVWWPAEHTPTYYRGTLHSVNYPLLEKFHQAKMKVIREGFSVKDHEPEIQQHLRAKPYLVHYEDGTREYHNLCFANFKLL